MVPIIGGEAVQAEEPAENDGAPPSLVDKLMRQVRARGRTMAQIPAGV